MARGEGGGQPTKCTTPVVENYLAAIEFGLSFDSACAEAGICKATLFNWRQWGAEGKEPYATFLNQEQRAIAVWERKRLNAMDDAGVLWTREAWKLERRMPDVYSKRNAVSVGQDPNLAPVQIIIAPFEDELTDAPGDNQGE